MKLTVEKAREMLEEARKKASDDHWINHSICVGDSAGKIAEKLKNVNWYTAIHPSAAVSEIDCKIGKGTVVMPNAVINAGAKIGDKVTVFIYKDSSDRLIATTGTPKLELGQCAVLEEQRGLESGQV